jgi:hypothetical protein
MNQLEDPKRQARALATIQAELVKAAREGRIEAVRQDLPTYRSALQIIPKTTTAYWPTLAAVVNAQTEANRKIGGFPDPTDVKNPCVSPKDAKLISNRAFDSCEIVLDGYTLIEVTFENSVIFYRGGDAKLARVHFSNCIFYLDGTFIQPPRQLALLASLLKSSDQKNVEVK